MEVGEHRRGGSAPRRRTWSTPRWPTEPARAATIRRSLPAACGDTRATRFSASWARGGMGVVYQARQVRLNRLVAPEDDPRRRPRRRRGRARFRPRPRRSPGSSTRNIVQIYDVGEHDGLPFFELEYCPGRQPGRAARRHPLAAAARRPRLVEHAGRRHRTRPTSWGSSTATSSRPTSCWPPTARPRSPTSAWPRCWTASRGLTQTER